MQDAEREQTNSSERPATDSELMLFCETNIDSYGRKISVLIDALASGDNVVANIDELKKVYPIWKALHALRDRVADDIWFADGCRRRGVEPLSNNDGRH